MPGKSSEIEILFHWKRKMMIFLRQNRPPISAEIFAFSMKQWCNFGENAMHFYRNGLRFHWKRFSFSVKQQKHYEENVEKDWRKLYIILVSNEIKLTILFSRICRQKIFLAKNRKDFRDTCKVFLLKIMNDGSMLYAPNFQFCTGISCMALII